MQNFNFYKRLASKVSSSLHRDWFMFVVCKPAINLILHGIRFPNFATVRNFVEWMTWLVQITES